MRKNKAKSKKAAKKRFKVTGSGKIMHRQTGQGHLLSKKSSRRKRRLGRKKELTGADAEHIKDLLPND